MLDLAQIDRTQLALVGGKAANLGELLRIPGVHVPPGFCVTTDVFRQVVADTQSIGHRLDRLSRLQTEDRLATQTICAEIRAIVESVAIPEALTEAIVRSVARLGEEAVYAVRSSATAEDLPMASFAGQHDTYLNVVGSAAIIQDIRRCWASLFSERAVAYRLRNGVDHRTVHMAVVVQRMVFPDVSGVLFTADPISGNRKLASVEAIFGLGEALVSGRVNADVYTLRDGDVVERSLASDQPALTDTQVRRLLDIGRRIEAHFDRPQDIEWCLADDDFSIVQSRPITTLFPIPPQTDAEHHVYLSVGHQQMMTDAMKPLGLSFWQMTTPRPMAEAGGRLFVDITRILGSRVGRSGFMDMIGRADPLIADALQTLLDRGDFVPSVPADQAPAAPPGVNPVDPLEADPSIVSELIERSQASIAESKRQIRMKSGSALLEFILDDLQELRRLLFDPRSQRVFMTAIEAAWWLNDHLQTWLGEKNAADTLTQSVPNNITSEMGLALLDVADVIRPHPEVVAFLDTVHDDNFVDRLAELPGGLAARDALRAWLDQYGMRCVGEIDITRPRWSEHPSALLPILLGNIKNFEPGAGKRRFEQGRSEALAKEHQILARLHTLPDGNSKADQTKKAIDRVRTFIGYREYPKYAMISRYFVYKLALLQEAERLVQAHVLRDKEDIFYLSFHELQELVRTRHLDEKLVRQRQADFRAYQALTPPRVLTSDGEGLNGAYRRDDVPRGALPGVPVSAGTVEGRARVVLDMADADLEPGDILVTAYTDPSWTPLFVAAAGLVTEVGGIMTHGAVIAREYGVPAVVAVAHATRLIHNGQRIRVHGSEGYVEIVESLSRY